MPRQLQVGDVVLVNNRCPALAGTVGEVTDIYNNGVFPILVLTDADFPYGGILCRPRELTHLGDVR